jgi:WD40 repeat protein
MLVTRDHKYIYTTGKDQTLKKFNIKLLQLEHDFDEIHDDWVMCMCETADGKYIFTGSSDGTMKQFCSKTNDLLRDFQQIHDYPVTCTFYFLKR